MADSVDINVVAENLVELLTNSVNMTSVFYDIFLNPVEMDVTLKQYNDENELVEVTIPNRAKDRRIALSGNGSPEGIVEAPIGVCYIDETNSIVYFKLSNSGNTGWVEVPTVEAIEDIVADMQPTIAISGSDIVLLNKEGIVTSRADIGDVSANKSLSNLDSAGNGIINSKANTDLSNLSSSGKAKIAIKEYVSSETYNSDDVVLNVNNGKVTFYRSIINNNTNNPLTDTTSWQEVRFDGRNVGELVASTLPLEDACLHLLDGSILPSSGIYSEFIDYIAQLYADDPTASYFISDTDYEVELSAYGVCGKYVYNDVNNTVRLPLITGFVEGTVNDTVVGNVVTAGLPNITGKIDGSSQTSLEQVFGETHPSVEGAFGIISGYQDATADGNAPGTMMRGLTFNASLSNSIYGNSNIVQPQSTKLLFYVVVANRAKTDLEVDIDEITTDLAAKADKVAVQSLITVVDSGTSGTSWYRVWSDGYCEQGGEGLGATTLLREFLDTSYSVLFSVEGVSTGSSDAAICPIVNSSSKTTTGFTSYTLARNVSFSYDVKWFARGYTSLNGTLEPPVYVPPTPQISSYYYKYNIESTAFVSVSSRTWYFYTASQVTNAWQLMYSDEDMTSILHNDYGNYQICLGTDSKVKVMIPSTGSFPGFLSGTLTLLQSPS